MKISAVKRYFSIIFLMFAVLSPVVLSNNSSINISLEPDAASGLDYINIDAIHFEHEKGSIEAKVSINLQLYSSDSSLTPGTYNVQFNSLKITDENFCNDIYTEESTDTLFLDRSNPTIFSSRLTSRSCYAECIGYSESIIMSNAGDDTLFSFASSGYSLNCYWSTYNNGGSINLIEGSFITAALSYSLHPTLTINSTDFNNDNVRVEIYDKISESWLEQDIDDLLIQHPQYKIRISDLQNNLLYRDSNYVNFTTYRTISINSLKLSNNSPEPVNISIYDAERETITTEISSDEYELNSVEETVNLIEMTTGSKNSTNYNCLENSDNSGLKLDAGENVEIENGIYNATYTFTDHDELDDWTLTQTGGTVSVVDYYAAHNDTMLIVDTSTTTNPWSKLSHTSQSTSITYQFWSYATGTKPALGIYIGGSTTAGYLWMENGGFWLRESGVTLYPSNTWEFDVWYHHTIEFDITAQEFNWYMNGTQIGGRTYDFSYSTSTIDEFQLRGIQSGTGSVYIDAVDISYDTEFELNRNLYELNSSFSELNATFKFDFSDLNRDVLYSFDLDYSYYTNVSTAITTSIYNYYSESYEQLSDNAYTSLTLLEHSENEFESIYFNSSMNFELNFYCQNFSSSFAMILDKLMLNVTEFSIISSSESYNVTYYSPSVYSVVINPYSSVITNISDARFNFSYVYVNDIYSNALSNDTIANQTSWSYTPPNMKQCFVSLADQSNIYLNWENYKIKINNSLVYSNAFYRELDTTINVSIYTRFDSYITSTLHTINREDNYIPIQLTRYNLKIYNQQSEFLHYNISLDPNYYPDSSIFWSEWLAPNEVSTQTLSPDHYKITLMCNESGTPNYVDYILDFDNDDILLISSANTIFAVLQNIDNLNSTIDEQFTYVSLNFTNTNSAIGNQTTLITLNFENYNTTFDDILLNQENSFEFYNTSFNTLLSYSENSFEFLNSSVNSLYQISNNSYVFINSTLLELASQSQNSFEFLNSSIQSVESLSYNSFEYLNTSVDSIETTMVQEFNFLESEIGENQLEILTKFGIVLSNVTNNSLQISSNILAINSSISNLVAELEQNVLLVNDTIYTAVLDVATNLAIDSETILGNISLNYEQNEFLTELFKETMFSDLLNWTGSGMNSSLVQEQIDTWTFTNEYATQSVELLLRYQEQVESMTIAAQNPLKLTLPKDAEFAVKSIETGEYLEEWEDLSVNNKSVGIGWYDGNVPELPDSYETELNDWMLFGIIAFICIVVVSVLYIYSKQQLSEVPKEKRNKKKKKSKIGVRDDSDLWLPRTRGRK